MAVGGAILAIGVIVTAVTYSAASGGGTYVVAYGAIGVGALQLLIGAFQHFAGNSNSQPEGLSEGAFRLNCYIHAISYVAAADGEIGEAEVVLLAGLLKRLTDQELAPAALKELAEAVGKIRFGSAEDFATRSRSLDAATRERIVSAAVMTALMEGDLAPVEWVRIQEIATALQIGPGRLASLRSDVEATAGRVK